MRKTQNFLRRAGSAALALTLTVSLCQPAFAATKAPFSKDETVYAVMAADGSVTKTTVSEHLYNAAGLAGVEDKSTLKNIVNTESFAEYTRNGDTLVWNTDDTDVYYKGDTDRQLPISAKVTYTLDGRTAPLSELLGKSGHLVLTIDLTNYETGKVTVNGKERTITLTVTALNVLREAKRKQNEMHLRAGSSWHNEYNMIFTRSNGMFVRFKTLYVHFKAIVKQMGRPEVRFHDVRHTYATLSLQSHVDPKTLSEALGHATVAFTLDVYGHSNADMRQQAADQLERLICQY